MFTGFPSLLNYLFVFLSLFSVALKSAVAAETPQSLLLQAADATAWSHTAQFDYECRATGTSIQKGVVNHFAHASNGTITRCGTLLRNSSKSNFGPNDDIYYERLVTPSRQIFWCYGGLSSDVDYTESLEAIKRTNGPNYGVPQWSWFLDGVCVLGDDIPVFDFVRAAKEGKLSELPPERIGGLDCRVVLATGDGWQFKAWIVPSRGYNFAKFEMTCDADPKRGRLDYKLSVDSVDFVEVQHNGRARWIVRSGKFHQVMSPESDEKSVDLTILMSRPRIVFDITADDEAFKRLPIPDGTAVMVTADNKNGVPQFLQTKFIWADGKPIRVAVASDQ